MILHTGGRASGEISTRSMPASSAMRSAWAVSTTPICSLSGPITRIGVMRIMWLTRVRRIGGPESLWKRDCEMGLTPYDFKAVTGFVADNASETDSAARLFGEAGWMFLVGMEGEADGIMASHRTWRCGTWGAGWRAS